MTYSTAQQHQLVKRTLNEYFQSVVISLKQDEKKLGEESFLEN